MVPVMSVFQTKETKAFLETPGNLTQISSASMCHLDMSSSKNTWEGGYLAFPDSSENGKGAQSDSWSANQQHLPQLSTIKRWRCYIPALPVFSQTQTLVFMVLLKAKDNQKVLQIAKSDTHCPGLCQSVFSKLTKSKESLRIHINWKHTFLGCLSEESNLVGRERESENYIKHTHTHTPVGFFSYQTNVRTVGPQNISDYSCSGYKYSASQDIIMKSQMSSYSFF